MQLRLLWFRLLCCRVDLGWRAGAEEGSTKLTMRLRLLWFRLLGYATGSMKRRLYCPLRWKKASGWLTVWKLHAVLTATWLGLWVRVSAHEESEITSGE